jgi:hypothetical protein
MEWNGIALECPLHEQSVAYATNTVVTGIGSGERVGVSAACQQPFFFFVLFYSLTGSCHGCVDGN